MAGRLSQELIPDITASPASRGPPSAYHASEVAARPWRMSWPCSRVGRRTSCSSRVCPRRISIPVFSGDKYYQKLSLVKNDIRGLIDSVNDGTTSAFMWEWFTTKPFVDAGEVRFVRHVAPTWTRFLTAVLLNNVDWLGAYAVAFVADRSPPLARPRTI
jgi:hypothetical protein